MDKYYYINRIIEREGGFQNMPSDHGNWTGGKVGVGENKGTKYGISAAAYPDLDIINLTKDAAIDLYIIDYWMPNKMDYIPFRLVEFHIDCIVHHGSKGAVKILQRAAGVLQDGIFGPITKAAIEEITLEDYVFARIEFFLEITKPKNGLDHKNLKFLRGWIYRAISLR